MKINELQEGVEYWMIIYGSKLCCKYRVKNGKLQNYKTPYGWVMVNIEHNVVVDAKVEPCEWMPKKGEKIYYPTFSDTLYEVEHWYDTDWAEAIKRNVGVYRTKEEAIAKAKELGWT